MRVLLIKRHLEQNAGEYFEGEYGVCEYLVKMGVATDKEVDKARTNANLDKQLKKVKK